VTSSKLGFSDWKYESPTGKSQLPSKFAAGKYSLSFMRQKKKKKNKLTSVREDLLGY
jgi:hypothetical protein